MALKKNLGTLTVLGMAVSACGSPDIYDKAFSSKDRAHINNKTKFSQAAYGVAASPRVTTSKNVRKGGGRRQLGKPYKIKSKWYTPKEDFGYDKKGQASWYGPNFHGRLTANGEVYDQYGLSAAHPTFPLPSYARVTNMANGRSIMVRVNDRGPYHEGRIIDLSAKAAEMLDYRHIGLARVRVEYVKQAPLHGRDHQMLAASYRSGGGGGLANTRLASSSAFGDWNRPSLNRLSDLTTGSIRKLTGTKPERADAAPEQLPVAQPDDQSIEANLSPVVEPGVDDEAKQDPFVAELEAARKSKDTGSTVALRLRKLFKPKSMAVRP